MVAAVSADCYIMLKSTEIATTAQELLAEIILKYLDQDATQVVTGTARETSMILEHQFDQVFFYWLSKCCQNRLGNGSQISDSYRP